MAGVRPRDAAPFGERFGDLIVIGDGEPYVRQRKDRAGISTASRWRCACVCGRVKDILPSHLRAGRTSTCGHPVDLLPKDPTRGCSAADCTHQHYAKGMCSFHYHRTRQGVPFDQPLRRSARTRRESL